jgi:beta-glucanase (GH16 family)
MHDAKFRLGSALTVFVLCASMACNGGDSASGDGGPPATEAGGSGGGASGDDGADGLDASADGGSDASTDEAAAGDVATDVSADVPSADDVVDAGASDTFVAIVGDDDDSPLPAPWIEVWRDDFRGPAGSAPDPAKWNVDVNAHPPNRELEYYTDRRDNTFLDGYGHLVIQALHENYMGSTQPYTSGRMSTAQLFAQAYGRFEARIKLPAGQGLWPAFWLLGANIADVGWPACGEIDIMEEAGSQPASTLGSVHGTNLDRSGRYTLPGAKLSAAFHVYALEWTPDSVTWFVDNTAYQTYTRAQLMVQGMSWGLDHPFFIILNLAVGGSFDGTPGAATIFPAQLFVDRVTVGRMPGPDDDAGSADANVSDAASSDATSSDEASISSDANASFDVSSSNDANVPDDASASDDTNASPNDGGADSTSDTAGE